jgi:hypothetical protein
MLSRHSALLPLVACLAALAVAGCGSSTGSSTASPSATVTGGTSPSGSAIAITPAPGWPAITSDDFVTTIDNPWFPLPLGTKWVSRGVKDGQPTVDTYEVTGQTKTIAGVTCSVIQDTLTTNGSVVEATWDWYAQDKQGNVWYFGEDTKEYDAQGNVKSTSGSWQTGVNGGAPGIFMPADPQVGMGGYQEYLKGEAMDQYKIISLSASVKVPYGSFAGCLETQETTALEPAVVDHKYYVKGIGQVSEATVKGGRETSQLVSYTKP